MNLLRRLWFHNYFEAHVRTTVFSFLGLRGVLDFINSVLKEG